MQLASDMGRSSAVQQSVKPKGIRRVGWKRWTIAGILFLMFCMAGFLTGFRDGLTEGVEQPVESRLADRKQVVYAVSYRIRFLLAVVRPSSQTETSLEPPDENRPTNSSGLPKANVP